MKNMAIFFLLFILFMVFNDVYAKNYHVRWKTKNGRIINSSICYNYTDLFDINMCRAQADKLIKKRCKATGSKMYCSRHRGSVTLFAPSF